MHKVYQAIKTKNKGCIELVLEKMLAHMGPDSFKWSNEKALVLTYIWSYDFNRGQMEIYDSFQGEITLVLP